jgi:membrane-associated phospholipid phosphatase
MELTGRDNPGPMTGPYSLDRRLGEALRRGAASVPGGTKAGRIVSGAMEPAFEALVAGMLVRSDARRSGVHALIGAAAASATARLVRDAIGRPRPGTRRDGGFPSRHAAAAVAIARTAGRRHRSLRPWLVGATVAGLIARVVAAEHDPADIAAGAFLGWSVAGLLERAMGPRT